MIGDRTQAPSGAGYALENRIVMSRILPEAFRDFHVQRLAGFFQAFRDTLLPLAPDDAARPRIVLLTPGPYNETYFEHAYLARYLGFTLVEGARPHRARRPRLPEDARRACCPCDVILRRLDDDFCDPLELRGESALGAPGLVQAVRAGNVVVANALGSGLRRDRRARWRSCRACAARCSARSCACRRSPPGGAASRPSAST